MKINWNRLFYIDRRKLMPGGFLLLAAGISFLYLDITKPYIKSASDLTFISGPFVNYDWISYSRGSSLTFRLENYNDRFKIKADFFSLLNKGKFESIPSGEIITIAIPNSFKKYLNTRKDPFFVYSISSVDDVYLDVNDVIKKHNSSFIMLAALSFILFGGGCIYFGNKLKRKLPNL